MSAETKAIAGGCYCGKVRYRASRVSAPAHAVLTSGGRSYPIPSERGKSNTSGLPQVPWHNAS